MKTPPEDCVVHVVDDDLALRRSLRFLFESVGWQVRLYASAEEFLEVAAPSTQPSCLVLDIRMPMMSGLELQQVLRSRGWAVPVVFITAYPERLLTGERQEPTYLVTKPFQEATVRAAISQALFFGSSRPLS